MGLPPNGVRSSTDHCITIAVLAAEDDIHIISTAAVLTCKIIILKPLRPNIFEVVTHKHGLKLNFTSSSLSLSDYSSYLQA